MSEYIIRWDGIGAQLTDMLKSHVPPYLWPKRIREERRLERIVRCRDCEKAGDYDGRLVCRLRECAYYATEADGYCHRGVRRDGHDGD